MSQPGKEDAIVEAALDLPPESRGVFLDKACGDDANLRQLVEALLKVHQRVFTLGEHPAAPLPGKTMVLSTPPTEKEGDRIGRYKLLQQVGEGGCGVVYMAEQEEPVRRRVALKVIKLGMDTRQVIARFEAERQALALMDHPNIAKVLDGGATDSGRPYFVMELVRGVKITDYCDQNNLPTAQRLDLFIQVCKAIQHAHQKGIIHRDIKPSNILVTLHDGVPVPKVIDFGIAKATEQRLTDKTFFTALEQFMGTPAYMSPEQAEMSGLDVDTRSDVYSLGVLLYELLTGRTPFDLRVLLKAGLEEMRRTIVRQEPQRPSTALSTMATADLATVAGRRQSDAPKLIHSVRGDLDWIVMKALEKDRTRRYQTATDLAADIRRHLADEPVIAGAPTVRYRFVKFVRRHKMALGIGTALAVLTLALLATASLLVRQLRAGKQTGLTVYSDPEGAAVWRDGRVAGTTPFNLTNLPPGEFSYALVLSNYESVTNKMLLLPNANLSDYVFLRRLDLSNAGNPSASGTNLTALTGLDTQGATISTLSGTVEVARNGAAGWVPARTNMALSAGDRVRTGRESRASLRLMDNSIVRIYDMTTLELTPPADASLPSPSRQLTNLPPGKFAYALASSNDESVTNKMILSPGTNLSDHAFLRPLEVTHAGNPSASGSNATARTGLETKSATILAITGTVEIARNGTTGWIPARTKMTLSAGDRVRTGRESRASLRLTDNSVMRLFEMTTLELTPPADANVQNPSLHLTNGTIHFFNRDGSKDGSTNFTPGMQIRG